MRRESALEAVARTAGVPVGAFDGGIDLVG
jgi:hypothetical protein